MRGEHASVSDFGCKLPRFIPACAGNTTPNNSPPPACIGSSPHARGTLSPVHGDQFGHRFIPACAGNTPVSGFAKDAGAVHPRMRGEHYYALEEVQGDVRFIPACAGNTTRTAMRGGFRSVHPRMRGEHASQYLLCHRPALGSSPHARGTLFPYIAAKKMN